MQMFQVYRLDRFFFHKLHYPPCCLGNFADYGRRGWSWHSVPVSKRRGAFSSILSGEFCKIKAQPASLTHQRRSDKMVSFRDYEIYLLFLLLVKFHGSGNCEIYSPAKDVTVFFTKCYFKLRNRKRRPLISERDVCQMYWCILNLRCDVGISMTW